MNRADTSGQRQYLGATRTWTTLLHGRRQGLRVREKIVPTPNCWTRAPTTPLKHQPHDGEGVVEAPGGAHFTECPPDYGRDEAFQRSTPASATRTRAVVGAFKAKYLDVTEADVPEGGGEGARQPSDHRRADICAVAVAEAFRGDGEIMVSPMSPTSKLGAMLARATFEPDLVMTDGVNMILADNVPLGADVAATRSSKAGCPSPSCSTRSSGASATS
jgi:hypothetical protein